MADLLKASNKIQAATGKETIVQPLPPIFLGGTTNAELIRSTFELMEWSKEYYGLDDSYLDDGHVTASAILSSQQEGEPRVVDLRRYSLPANKNSSSMRVWASGGKERKALPCSVKALTPTAKKEYLDSLIGELRARQALQLDLEPTLDRVIYSSTKVKRHIDIMVVGSSNASKLVDALIAKGKSVMLVMEPHWVINRQSVDQLATRMHRELQHTDPDITVLQFLDNSCFFARRDDGSRILPIMMDDGRYHLPGEIVVCSQETQAEQFRLLKPIFNALDRRNALCIGPMPRYVVAGCCEDRSHAVNRRDDDYRENMSIQLDAYQRGLKEYLFSTGIKNIKVLDPSRDLRGLSREEIWGSDPVHPQAAVYRNIANGVLKMASNITVNRKEGSAKRTRSDSGGDQDRERRFNREDNMSTNDRSGRSFNPGQGFGGRGARGGHRPYGFSNRARPYFNR
jgi:hypothetical protein